MAGGAGAAPSGPGRRRRATPRPVVALRVLTAFGVVLLLGAVVLFVPASPLAISRARPSAGGAPTDTADPDPDPTDDDTPTPTPTPTPSPTPRPLAFRMAPVTVPTGDTFFSWSVMDRRTGEIWGSTNLAATTWPASMIKAWIAADYLRRSTESKTTLPQSRIDEITIMIRDSDNDSAEDIFNVLGRNASLTRLLRICKFTDTTIDPRGWGFLDISARDTVRLADCIADGTAAGPQWTDFLLNLMRTVRQGNWGIRDALPAADSANVAIKNGWLNYTDDGYWHVNCMAVSDTWAMSVMQRYPIDGLKTETFGAQNCKNVATTLLNPAYVSS